MSRSLATTIVRAKDYASAKGHRLVTLEHLLLALIEDEEAAPVLVACKADLDRLGQDVAAYLARQEREPPGGSLQPNIAPELKRIVEYAASAAQQGRRSQVDGAIVLAAMIGEGQSVAAGFLRAQELTFEDVVRTLQQQAQERAVAAQQNGAVPPSAEDIIANARERIAAASRGTGGRVSPLTEPRGPQPGGRGPATSQQNAGLGDRARPPIFAERPRELPAGVMARPATQHDAGSTSAEAPKQEPSQPTQQDASTTGTVQAEVSEQVAVRAPPPLPQSPQKDDVAADPPPRAEAEPSHSDEQPPLPDWMKARQLNPGHGPAGGPPPPPPVRDEPKPTQHTSRSLRAALDGVSQQPAHDAADPGNRPPPTLEAAPRRAAAAPARVPRLAEKPAVEPGQIVENIPRRMRVGITETVEVRIGHAGAHLTDGLQGSGAPVRHDAFITKAMSVRLRAPGGGFIIDSASPDTQWIQSTVGPLASDFAAWRFSITPTRRGAAVLQLVVAARVVGRDGITAETALPERVISVHVRTNYVRATIRVSAWLAALAIGGAVGRMGEDALAYALKLINGIGAAG